jgi:myo-inositol 2-dehydrogenase / D-chiro-inositol 1-dehydrogenase
MALLVAETGALLLSLDDADANKEKTFIESIEKGNYLNNLQSGAESTLTAILGREAAELKKEMTWNEVITSNEKLDPKLNLSQFDKH